MTLLFFFSFFFAVCVWLLGYEPKTFAPTYIFNSSLSFYLDTQSYLNLFRLGSNL